MRILIAISSLGPGGAERVASSLANAWAERGNEVVVLTLSDRADDHFQLNKALRDEVIVEDQGLSYLGRTLRVAKEMLAIRRSIQARNPEYVISFIDKTNIKVLLSLTGTRYRTIVSERSNPRRMPISFGWSVLRHMTYRMADAIVTQTTNVAEWARERFPSTLVVTIPNPVAIPTQTPEQADREKNVIAIGRFSEEKGFDLLLSAWRMAFKNHPEWQLIVLGDGPLRSPLMAQAAQAQLSASVQFPGLVPDPSDWLSRSSIFVLSSRFEGFPNALLEACANRLAIVSFDCDHGPRDIIKHGVSGFLAPPENTEELAAYLDRLMRDEPTRHILAEAAYSVSERFSFDSVLETWDQLFEKLSDPHYRD